MGRADQTTKVKGMFVHPGEIVGGRQAPSRARPRAAVRHPRGRAGHHDAAAPNAPSPRPVSRTRSPRRLQSVTKLKGAVELVAPGSLPNDGKVIADERPVG